MALGYSRGGMNSPSVDVAKGYGLISTYLQTEDMHDLRAIRENSAALTSGRDPAPRSACHKFQTEKHTLALSLSRSLSVSSLPPSLTWFPSISANRPVVWFYHVCAPCCTAQAAAQTSTQAPGIPEIRTNTFKAVTFIWMEPELVL